MDTPKVFISYSWDSDEHKDWVRNLAYQLIANGVSVILDQYEIQAGDNITHFMERSVGDTDMVLLILTESYKIKSEKRSGGVGYEYSIINAEWYKNQAKNTKFIPILRGKDSSKCVPNFLSSYVYIDMSVDNNFDKRLIQLIYRLYGERIVKKPPLGKKPDFGKILDRKDKKETDSKNEHKKFDENLQEETTNKKLETLYGVTVDKENTFEGIKIIPDNKTLMILQVNNDTDDIPIPRKHKNIKAIFEYYQPQREVDLIEKDGDCSSTVFKFNGIKDFTKEGIVEQSVILKNLDEERKMYNKFKNSLHTDKKLRSILSHEEHKANFIELLDVLIEELGGYDE